MTTMAAAGAGDPADRPPDRTARDPSCPLCTQAGGEIVWRGPAIRVILPDEPQQPGVVRVVLEPHVAELSDLPSALIQELMAVVVAVERIVRRTLQPDKINLASLGNRVPHLHWHVVPRWRDDARFPDSPWSAPTGADPMAAQARADSVVSCRGQLARALAEQLPRELGVVSWVS
jgi:diadenosine tetraphosphate (Ap4A) HIT family hydrolase